MSQHSELLCDVITRLSQYRPRQLEAVAGVMDWIESLCGDEEEGEREKAGRKKGVQSGSKRPHSIESKDWPRAPLHRLEGKGTFIVTGFRVRQPDEKPNAVYFGGSRSEPNARVGCFARKRCLSRARG